MKFTAFLGVTLMCTTVLFIHPTKAAVFNNSTVNVDRLTQNNPGFILGIFTGEGYTLEVGNGGDYVGQDSSNNRLVISSDNLTANRSNTDATWVNAGYRYRVTALGPADSEGATQKVLLRVYNPKGKMILKKTLRASS
jgi:hypothetical protein